MSEGLSKRKGIPAQISKSVFIGILEEISEPHHARFSGKIFFMKFLEKSLNRFLQ